jgi:hypothetical protein
MGSFWSGIDHAFHSERSRFFQVIRQDLLYEVSEVARAIGAKLFPSCTRPAVANSQRRLPKPSLLESFDKFHFDWNVDVAFIVRGSQKFTDSRASGLTIIASEFIHVHADEFTGEIRTHIARVAK